MRQKRAITTTHAIGYLTKKDALAALDRECDEALVDTSYGRGNDLHEVRKIMEVFNSGHFVHLCLRHYTKKGTVLGYRRHPKRGWVMGLLLSPSGLVKEITIDPQGYAEEHLEAMQEPGRDRVYLLGKHLEICKWHMVLFLERRAI